MKEDLQGQDNISVGLIDVLAKQSKILCTPGGLQAVTTESWVF